MATHLVMDCYYIESHPARLMDSLGITYQHATPQSLSDQWWFWNCENIPDPLPKYLKVMNKDPFKLIGHGLSAEDAKKIVEYKSS